MTATVGQQAVVVPFIQFSKTDASGMMTTIPGYGSTTRCCYLSASSELSLTNQDQAAVKVVIYDLICRRDKGYDPATLWTTGESDEGVANAQTVVGCLPFSSDLLCQYWKVCKATHLSLEQGKNQVHRVRYTPNKVISNEILSNGPAYLERFSVCTFVTIHGLPTNDATTKNLVSTGECAVDFIYKNQSTVSRMLLITVLHLQLLITL